MVKKFPFKSILIACSVNTARSPMAEGFLKDFFRKKKFEHIVVKSCGVASNARDGMLISMDAKMAMKEIGIKLPEHSISIDLKKHQELLKNVDLILTLTEKHKKDIKSLEQVDGIRILTIKEFAGESGDIKDPSMKGIEGFRVARNEIINCLLKGLNKYSY
ncbi:MAG: hypothetical protein EU539_11100 [Promethearchaeota archaeon]|nr:MAG: hypothetical protein EU539_11100 [Candidatus Lokiarchaeota archaeon]